MHHFKITSQRRGAPSAKTKSGAFLKYMKANWQLYLFVMPALFSLIVFQYLPMYGVQIAFKNYVARLGITGSEWIGFDNFERFLSNPSFINYLKNTVSIAFTSTMITFPFTVLFALLLNQLSSKKLMKTVQFITYVPHFISTVVLVGMIKILFSYNYGIINQFLERLGLEHIDLFSRAEYFLPTFVGSGIWQGLGWGAIIYIAALSSVPIDLHEAAVVDGASKLRRLWSIDLPCIMPTIIIQFILAMGNAMNVSFEKAYLMQTDLNLSASEVISTYTYKIGILERQYSYSTAIGLFNSLICFAILLIVNQIAKRISETSLF